MCVESFFYHVLFFHNCSLLLDVFISIRFSVDHLLSLAVLKFFAKFTDDCFLVLGEIVTKMRKK